MLFLHYQQMEKSNGCILADSVVMEKLFRFAVINNTKTG
jgi:hypothetical protein